MLITTIFNGFIKFAVPPDDEGWFCKFCKIRMEIIESTNVHLGTHFAVNSNWEVELF